MPEIGHFIIAFSIIIPILYFAGDKFNYKVAAIFIITNWIGPDSAQAYGFFPIDFHYLVPYFLWAGPLALFYSYLSRFSIKRSQNFFKLKDDGIRVISWKNSYLLCISAGLIHTISDTIFRNNLKIKFIEGFSPTIFDLHRFGFFLEIELPILQIISYIILITITLLTVYIVDKNFKDILLFFISIIGLTLLIIFFLGEDVVGGEYDGGVVAFSFLFIFLPLFLLFYVAKDVNINPRFETKTLNIGAKFRLKIAMILSLLVSTILLLIGILGILFPSILQEILDFNKGTFLILGIIFLSLGSMGVFSALGLLLRCNYCRYYMIFICLIMTIFVFPLAILLYLCQNEIKAVFVEDLIV